MFQNADSDYDQPTKGPLAKNIIYYTHLRLLYYSRGSVAILMIIINIIDIG